MGGVMKYVSTRGHAPVLEFDEVLLAGLARDGGLYLPETWPQFSATELRGFSGLGYAEIALRILRPFVGRAGQLLDLMLMSVGLRRDEVYICNVLKCRPPGNRNPQPEEVAACSPLLLQQIDLIDPKVIVAFGTFAAQTLLGIRESIGRLRGRTHLYGRFPLVVTYHPAASLRNPGWKRPTWEDLQIARRVMDGDAGLGSGAVGSELALDLP